jgi:hypothetical protein
MRNKKYCKIAEQFNMATAFLAITQEQLSEIYESLLNFSKCIKIKKTIELAAYRNCTILFRNKKLF